MQATGVSPQQLINAILQACIVCIWVIGRFYPVPAIVARNLWGHPDCLNHLQGRWVPR